MTPRFHSALTEVSYTYPRAGSPALSGVNLEIREGEWLALLGRNGSGKSTLAKHLNALLVPTQGACFVSGLDTRDPAVQWEVRQHVAVVFQNPDNQLVAAVVEEDAAFGPENAGLAPHLIRERVKWALEVTSLSGKARTPTYALSGGQKQRLAVAGALAMNPPCIVLDEATAMLDPQGRQDILRVVRHLHDGGMTIVQITHRLEEIMTADRVVVVDEGRAVWTGAPVELFALGSELDRWGLEVPPMVRLWARLREGGLFGDDVVPSAGEVIEALCR